MGLTRAWPGGRVVFESVAPVPASRACCLRKSLLPKQYGMNTNVELVEKLVKEMGLTCLGIDVLSGLCIVSAVALRSAPYLHQHALRASTAVRSAYSAFAAKRRSATVFAGSSRAKALLCGSPPNSESQDTVDIAADTQVLTSKRTQEAGCYCKTFRGCLSQVGLWQENRAQVPGNACWI